LGLSLAGLHHNMRDERKITRQTEIILDMLERESEDRITTPPQPRITTPPQPRIATP
jgi:hypothetical protein